MLCSNIVPLYVPIALPPSVALRFAQDTSGKCRTLLFTDESLRRKGRALRKFSERSRVQCDCRLRIGNRQQAGYEPRYVATSKVFQASSVRIRLACRWPQATDRPRRLWLSSLTKLFERSAVLQQMLVGN